MRGRTKRRPYGERGIIRPVTYEEARAIWLELAEDLSDPDVELTAEEFGPILSTYQDLVAMGHPFDPLFMALMAKLERQVAESDDGSPWDPGHVTPAERMELAAVTLETMAEAA